MATDLIRYDLLVQDALRSVVRTVLADAAKNGLKGDHHFFITFRTDAPGLRLSDRMRERYPEEMTIILQHQFWDLGVTDSAFEVGLSFSNKPERLLVPFAAITTFHDPSVQFGLKFELTGDAPQVAAGETAPASKPTKRTLTAVTTEPDAADKKPPGVPALAKPAAPAGEATLSELKPHGVAKPADSKGADAKLGKAAKPAEATDAADEGKKVVSIDAFRKKP